MPAAFSQGKAHRLTIASPEKCSVVGRDYLRLHLPLQRKAPQTRRPHHRPNGAGRPLGETEHCRRLQSLHHLCGDGTEAHQRRPRQPGGASARRPRLPPRPATTPAGTKTARSPLRPQTRPPPDESHETHRPFMDTRSPEKPSSKKKASASK